MAYALVLRPRDGIHMGNTAPSRSSFPRLVPQLPMAFPPGVQLSSILGRPRHGLTAEQSLHPIHGGLSISDRNQVLGEPGLQIPLLLIMISVLAPSYVSGALYR